MGKFLLGLILAAGIGIASPVIAQEASGDPEKIEDIQTLMEITGSNAMGEQVLEQMINGFSRSRPDIPMEFWSGLRTELDPNGLVELIIPIYDKHLSHEDIKNLIAFYKTDTGVKFLEVLPAIGEESYYAGQQWGSMIAQKVIAKLEAEGYETGAAGAPTAPAVPATPQVQSAE